MGSHMTKVLRPRHERIIRLAFEGWTHKRIAGALGFSAAAVSCILRSPLAQGEIARLRGIEEEKITNIPLRTRLAADLEGASKEALDLNRKLMNEPLTDTKVRVGIARHFMDRVVFGDLGDEKEGTYREILRKLDKVQHQIYIDKAVITTGGNGAPGA